MANLSTFNFIQTTPICLSDAVLLRRIKSGKMRIDATGCIEKRCAKCRDYWPADLEFFYSATTVDGLNEWCKACYIEHRWPQGRTPVAQPFSGDCSLLYQLPVKQKLRNGVCA